jgi:hypothetical protein
MRFQISQDLRFAHPSPGNQKQFRILPKGTVVQGLATQQMTPEQQGWLKGMTERDLPNQRRIAFMWLDKFRTGIIGEDLIPCVAGGVISKRNW